MRLVYLDSCTVVNADYVEVIQKISDKEAKIIMRSGESFYVLGSMTNVIAKLDDDESQLLTEGYNGI